MRCKKNQVSGQEQVHQQRGPCARWTTLHVHAMSRSLAAEEMHRSLRNLGMHLLASQSFGCGRYGQLLPACVGRSRVLFTSSWASG